MVHLMLKSVLKLILITYLPINLIEFSMQNILILLVLKPYELSELSVNH